MNTPRPWATLFRFAIVAAWLLGITALVHRETSFTPSRTGKTAAITASAETSFYSLYQGEKQIGAVTSTLTPDGDTVTLVQDARILLNLLGKTQPLTLSLTARLSPDLTLRRFTARLDSPFYHMAARGVVEDNFLRYAIDTGKAVINNAVRLTQKPRLSTGSRPWLLHPLPKKGERFQVPFVDPFTLTTRKAVLTYHGKEKVMVRRMVRNLHHFSERFSGVRISSWLDESGRVVREMSPAGFLLVRQPTATRLSLEPGQDLLQSVAIPLKGTRPDILFGRTARYHLEIPDPALFDLHGGRQSFANNIVTIHRQAQQETNCLSLPADLGAEPFIQANHPEIRALAASIVGNSDDPAVQVRRLAGWIFAKIKKQPVIGLPDALTTLKTQVGDCNEHAALFTALARSLKIPTRIATGVALFKDHFYYHAWNEACVKGRWISIDTTTNQVPADLGHIRFLHGGMEEATRLVSLLHRLKIRAVDGGQ